MSKKMLVNATHHEENRVAIVEDGILTELDIEVAGHEPTKGNIYRAVVVRVESGLQAAFVDYGAERLGFLQIDEINYKAVKPDYQPAEDGRRPRITDLLQRGQEVLVQITKEERGTKGAAMTTYLSLAGRYMVVMPGSQTRGVSRKAESDSQRKELKQSMASLDLAENIGYIVRTAALNQTREELERDYRYLLRLFESIKDLEQKVKAPALIYKESNLIIRSIRDYFTTDMDEVLIDDPQVFKEAKDFFQMVMPDQVKLVKLHQERRPIFSRYQIEEQIETLSRNKVPLPSGGSIVIDPTEALVAIDVNSGKMASEQGVEATATKTNIEAAREVGRQLRLRDLGGLVVIDFIDMRERKHAREVEKEVKKSLENDKARVSVGRISQFGLLEMSRQRIKGVLAEGTYLTCPHCQGTGHMKSPETQAVSLLRKIHASAAKGQVSRVDAQLPIGVASYLLNHKREELVEMERDHQLQIHIHGNRDFMADQVEIEITKKEKDKAAQPEYISAGTLPMPVEVSAETENEASQPVPAEGEPENGKKRRRRRRRKPSAAATESPRSAEQDMTNQQDPEVPADEAVSAEPQPVEENEQKAPDQTARKPQRRRRSQSKPKPVESGDKPEAAETQAEAAATDQKDKAESSEKESTEARPRRQRGRRKPKAASEAPQSETADTPPGQTQASSPPDSPEPSAEVNEATGVQATESKPKQRRPRRTARKTEQPAAPAVNAPDKPAEQTPTGEAPQEQKKAPRRPTRRSPKKTDQTPENTAVSTDTSEATQEEKKPARRSPARRPGKKVAPDNTVAPDNQSSIAPSQEGAVEKLAEDKPKPRRGRPRKKPVKAESLADNS